ncbi:hypothetical protein PENFLA_c046G05942 [Penicillium flavigenum]|uniref:Uncharacterized protein n=1 Tax=Penicillium flavigenum TaxID=254877 RepID=A0A1V6SHN2_9EURO|nr:hypothetical protein PENFLA_c046G05942 [Penicillium flavigenum]
MMRRSNIHLSPLLNLFRRYPRGLYLALLAILLLFISGSVLNRRSTVIQPGDLVGSGSREVRPQDDQTPFAHEPVGLGTLRDVREDNFYRGGTLTLARGSDYPDPARPVVYDPYPDYNSDQWRKEFLGSFLACDGPRGRPLSRSNIQDMVSVYPGIPRDFPLPLLGSYAETGIDAYTCTNRFSRLGAYGFSDDTQPQVNLDEANWGTLQLRCFERNAARYSSRQTDSHSIKSTLPLHPPLSSRKLPRDRPRSASRDLKHKSRSAVILRAWHDIDWTENLKQSVRSLIMELSLHSGGEYEVFILCHVKDKDIPVYTDDGETMQSLKSRFVPREFLDMTILFNDKTLKTWYPKVDEHSTNYQYWQPVQIFSQSFQEFEYYWQLEMDARFTGHSYHFLEKSVNFAKRQPRKYLWERNAYFYIPGTHGSWQDFIRTVGSSMNGQGSVWGPQGTSNMTPVGPKPTVSSPEDDKYEWGVGEEADFITFLPIFDPVDTKWVFSNKLWGVSENAPRRASPVAIGRISKTLAQQMHDVQIQRGMGLVSEMTAPTLALWHGLKAVHVPHPVYVDGKWTAKELGRILNPGDPQKINGGGNSIWNWDHQWDHILYRLSYMFSTQTAEDLYRRWLGYPIDPNQFTDGSYHQDPQGRNWFESGDLREDLYGPLCFPSMLLHTVKNTAEKKGSHMAVPV